MKFSKGYALPMLLIIALGAIGFSYAWWTETLVIDGNVNMGEVKVVWNYDPWERPSVWADAPASGSWRQIDDHTFEVTFTNLYPGCVFKWQGYARNMGTIPVKFDRCDIEIVNDPKNVTPHIFVVPGDTYISWDPDGNGPLSGSYVCPVWGGYSDFPFTYLDEAINEPPGTVPEYPHTRQVPKFVLYPPSTPGDWRTAGRMAFCGEDDSDSSIRLIVNPNAPDSIEGATLTFRISFKFVQWNAP